MEHKDKAALWTLRPHMENLILNSVKLIRGAHEEYSSNLVYPTSLGISGNVMIDMICTYVPEIKIITLDTGMLHPETLQLHQKLEAKYGIVIERIKPSVFEVASMIENHGVDLYRKSVSLRKLCCEVRKVNPLKDELHGKAWLTGRRSDQSDIRLELEQVELNPSMGVAKFNPLLSWSRDDIWFYVLKMGLPYNNLFDQHYGSIGCAPCTRAVTVGEDERSGRWWWENKDAASECGLHMNPISRQTHE